jgi:hypothetical protein
VSRISEVVFGLSLLLGCAATVPPGPGSIGQSAHARLEREQLTATAEAARRAAALAAASDDTRAWRKAAALGALAARQHAAPPDEIRAWSEPVLRRLQSDCDARLDGAELLEALDDDAASGDMLLGAVHQCGSVEAAIRAPGPLRRAQRCDQAIAAIRSVWPHAPHERWMALLDGVNVCSDPVTLRANLAFAPPEVVAGYFAELLRRAEEEREMRRRIAAQRAAERAASEHMRASMDCSSDCNQAVSSCDVSCSGDPACLNRCSALGSACRSGCH